MIEFINNPRSCGSKNTIYVVFPPNQQKKNCSGENQFCQIQNILILHLKYHLTKDMPVRNINKISD
jgi:hypothetical protein